MIPRIFSPLVGYLVGKESTSELISVASFELIKKLCIGIFADGSLESKAIMIINQYEDVLCLCCVQIERFYQSCLDPKSVSVINIDIECTRERFQ